MQHGHMNVIFLSSYLAFLHSCFSLLFLQRAILGTILSKKKNEN